MTPAALGGDSVESLPWDRYIFTLKATQGSKHTLVALNSNKIIILF